jgi:hypothetical protein
MNTRKLWMRLACVGLAIVLVLPASATVLADDGVLDVGAEYPSADSPAGSSCEDRPIHQTSVQNFYNKMRAAGYTGSDSFIWGNSSAWETDWKRSALGGQEESWVDDVDIMFVHSHGGYGSLCIPWDHTDTSVVPGDCSGSWGTNDLEWLGIKSCQTLGDRTGWAGCMNGVNLIAGFTTNSASVEFGGYWADMLLGARIWLPFIGYIWLRAPKSVTQAWFTTCDARTGGATARVIAERTCNFNDKVWDRGGPACSTVVDNTYHWIDHTCYKAAPAMLDVSLLAEVPTYRVLDRTVDEGFAASLASTLNVSGTLSLSPDGQEYAVTDTSGGITRTLTVNTATGGYQYQDLSQLWMPPEEGEPLNLPGPDEAARLADAYFLATAQALPGGQNFDPSSQHIETDMMSTSSREGGGTASAVLAETGVDVMVAYGRVLETTATAASGEAVRVGVSVAGPGSSTKMYLGGQGSAPIALSGGSRDVSEGNTVPLKDASATWEAFLEDHDLALLEIPIQHDEMVRNPILDTFAYFEQPLDMAQEELIPSWVYTVDFLLDGQVVGDDYQVYVPASPDYYPPDVVIDSPVPGATIVAGKAIKLEATVVSGNGPFTYEWSSDAQGVLGIDEDITTYLVSMSKPGELSVPVGLSLKVTDANSLSRWATVSVDVVGEPVWLPIVTRD